MRKRHIIFAISLVVVDWAISPAALAQGRRGIANGRHQVARPERAAKVPRPDKNSSAQGSIDNFARMSPDQRQQALAQLPPQRAEKVRKQLNAYSNMSPEQQAAAREQLNAFRNLTPERQEGMRKAFSKFSRQPAERQQLIRQELNQLRGLPQADRSERLNSPEFQGLFNNNERKIIREMSDLLP